MGVAVRVRISTTARNCLSLSLCVTPKRCSSSTINEPEVLEGDILLEQPVGADDDVDRPLFHPFQDHLLLLAAVRKRESISTLTG